MHSSFQKTKRQLKRKAQKAIQQVKFIFKMSVMVLVLFLMVMLYITKPSFGPSDSHSQDEGMLTWPGETKEEAFIDKMAPHAKEAQRVYGVRPSVLIAQAALESSWGESALSQEANNYFGIKAANKGADYATREYTNNTWVEIDATFRRYDSVEESVMDYARLLSFGTDWNADLYLGAIQAANYKDAAKAIQAAGYATDPNYSDKLIQIIEQYQLYELDAFE